MRLFSRCLLATVVSAGCSFQGAGVGTERDGGGDGDGDGGDGGSADSSVVEVADCAGPGVIVENFAGDSPREFWQRSSNVEPQSVTIRFGGGMVTLTNTGTVGQFVGLVGRAAIDLTGGTYSAEVDYVGGSPNQITHAFALDFDGDKNFGFKFVDGQIFAFVDYFTAAPFESQRVPFLTEHRFIQVRELGGVIHFETRALTTTDWKPFATAPAPEYVRSATPMLFTFSDANQPTSQIRFGAINSGAAPSDWCDLGRLGGFADIADTYRADLAWLAAPFDTVGNPPCTVVLNNDGSVDVAEVAGNNDCVAPFRSRSLYLLGPDQGAEVVLDSFSATQEAAILFELTAANSAFRPIAGFSVANNQGCAFVRPVIGPDTLSCAQLPTPGTHWMMRRDGAELVWFEGPAGNLVEVLRLAFPFNVPVEVSVSVDSFSRDAGAAPTSASFSDFAVVPP